MEEAAQKLTIEYWPLAKLRKHPRNPKSHRLDEIHKSMDRFGYTSPILIDERSGRICAGHGRIDTLLERFARDPGQPPAHIDAQDGEWRVPVIRGLAFKDENELEAYLVADNRLTEIGGWDNQKLLEILRREMATQTLAGTGYDQADLERLLREAQPGQSLAEKFLIPPFSVFDTRQGYWQDRKRAWLALGIESEIGRGTNLLKMSATVLQPDPTKRNFQQTSSLKGGLTFGTTMHPYDGMTPQTVGSATGTSVFDPVLSELIYRWFCPAMGSVLDPFAGGSVRGIVAAYLDLRYTGIDLRQEQVQANLTQAAKLKLAPEWIVGNSMLLDELLPSGAAFDLLFSCPPYFDLEQYSDNPSDLSNAKTYENFLVDYRQIVKQAAARLKPHRFACFVVSDIRDPKGFYRNFVSDTIDAFQAAGLWLYNECILVNTVGSLLIRVNKQFVGYRKVGKCHQNVLIFFNGDTKQIRQDYPVVELPDPDQFFGESEEEEQKPTTAIMVQPKIPPIPPFQIDLIDGIQVVRDDRVPGGTKRRVLETLLKPGSEYVYASPGCGAAQVALAYTAAGLPDTRVTIFTAECKQPHARTLEAMQAGAKVVFVPYGYFSNVTAKARIYADQHQNAVLLPFGLDDAPFHDGLVWLARSLKIDPPEVWSVVGSGTLTRALQEAWPKAAFHGVIVGAHQLNVGRATVYEAPESFTRDAKIRPPFPSCSNYDAKAWRFIQQFAQPGALFWNVAG